jgi:regulatory protein
VGAEDGAPGVGAGDAATPPFKDAEAWLAERGIERDPIRVGPPTGTAPAGEAPGAAPEAVEEPGPGGAAAATPPITDREATRLAAQAEADAAVRRADADALPDPAASTLEADVAEALAFVRRSTAMAPQAQARVAEKLGERGWPPAVVERTLERARRERLLDDPAMLAALVAERREKRHAPARIRRDLRERGFEDAALDAALADTEREDPEAAAFDVARERAERLSGVDAETAFRRVLGHVARRGYPEGLARKVAREAVFTARDRERTAGH